ncbi:MAG: EamA family transporter RarD, partial [Actinobacteria bacterium]|nr:EamA family transporter RarD [Actinomycetota bacterium]
MNNRLGYIYGFAAYLCWGAFPLFFSLLSDIDPYEVVPWRVITALVFCVLAVGVMRAWGPVFQVLRSRRMFGWFALASVVLYVNWQVFVVGIV